MDVIAISLSSGSVYHIINDLGAESLHRQPAHCGFVPKRGWDESSARPSFMLNQHNTCIRCYKLYTAPQCADSAQEGSA